MQESRVNGIERVMSVTKVGEVVTLIETKKSTYQRTKRGLRLISSKEIKTKIVNRSQSSSADRKGRGE